MGRAGIMGGGPAGLTAAYEFLDGTTWEPVVLEREDCCGGLARTVTWRGNRMDLGGHRFYSRADRVTDWWTNILPLQGAPARDDMATGRRVALAAEARVRQLGRDDWETRPAPDPEREDAVMLRRARRSRIRFRGRFIDYPLGADPALLRALGPWNTMRALTGMAASRLRGPRPERSLEDFFVNRFGGPLYELFFRGYTEKVWGVPCASIEAEWGAQRVKGVSPGALARRALAMLAGGGRSREGGEPSLIESFLYPKFGPGQLWETVAGRLALAGAPVRCGCEVVGLDLAGGRVTGIEVRDRESGERRRERGDVYLSTLPVRSLVRNMRGSVPAAVRAAAEALPYRDFMVVGLLAGGSGPGGPGRLPDTWIYLQDGHLRAGRVQVFNNWSPYLAAEPGRTWLGLEFFCNEGDALWSLPDEELCRLAADELDELGLVAREAVLDGTVVRVRHAYPGYYGGYTGLAQVRDFLDAIPNLFLVGRNGMHRYNNMDHSMLTAMEAVDTIASGRRDKAGIWNIKPEDL